MCDSARLLSVRVSTDSDADDDARLLGPSLDEYAEASARLLDGGASTDADAVPSRPRPRLHSVGAAVAGAFAALVVILVLVSERSGPVDTSHTAKISLSAQRSMRVSQLDAVRDADEAGEAGAASDYGGYHAGQGGDVEPLGRLDFGDERYDWSQLAPEWTTSVERTTTAAPCGWVEENIFYPGNDLQDGSKVPSPEECCAQCAQNSECVGWSWERSTWDCALKGNKPRPMLAKLADERYVSGQPTQVRAAVPLMTPQAGQSLFCFSLMMPYGYEPVLLGWQFEQGASIFACDEYAVYSNVTLTVAPGLTSQPIASSLACAKGGEFKTALNTDIFIAVWARIVSDGRFRFHDFTVKVDPDAVFMAQRLRGYAARHPERASGLYLNNCRRGMHGPVEVLSRRAVEVWWGGIPGCQAHFGTVCSGPCEWGEDMFMDQCLDKVLKVDRKNNSKLLVEEACDPPKGWESCKDEHIAAYHPFKEVGAYKTCLVSSGITGLA
mmetsp:Transcript_51825/g.134929  ORF Transcript_51825/g.134929 Transcript_51825/m.134929 type:complete len:496 (-) Transcript_51825:391-1878(-)